MKSNILRIVLPVLSCLLGVIGTAAPRHAYADGMCICLDPPGCTQYVCPDGSTQPASNAQSPSASPTPSDDQSPSASPTPSDSQSPSVTTTPSDSQSPSVTTTPSDSQSPSVTTTPSVSQSPSVSTMPSEQNTSDSYSYEGSDAFYDPSKTHGVDYGEERDQAVCVFNFGLGVTGGVFLPEYVTETKQSALDNVVGNVDATITLGFFFAGENTVWSRGFLIDQHLGFAALSGKVTDVPQDKFFLGITDFLFTFNIFPVNDVFFEMGIGAGFSYSDFFFGMTIPLKMGVVIYLNDYWAFGINLIVRGQISLFGDVDSEGYEMGGVISHYSIGIEPMIQFIYRPNVYKDEIYRHYRYGD